MSGHPLRVEAPKDLDPIPEPETTQPAPEAELGADGASAEIDLDHLRRLLLGYDDERLDRLQGWLNDPSYRAKEISEVLPRAVRLRPEGDSQLGEALAPAIETAFVDFVRREPQAAARVLAPVIGDAIRQAVRERLFEPLRMLRLAATLPGFRWWLQARRSRKSFAEVADQHTLVYRVECLQLYHSGTGTLLVEAENPTAPRLPREDLSEGLDRIRQMLGSSTEGKPAGGASKLGLVIEQGPRLVLAAVVRGEAPELLHDRVQAVLDAIHLERRLSLKTFAGDAAPFELCRPQLEKLFEAEYHEPQANKAIWLSTAVVLGAAALAWWYS